MLPRELRATVWNRCTGCCEQCGKPTAGQARAWWMRCETGPQAASNVLLVCGDVTAGAGCVSDLFDNMVRAGQLGWVVRPGRDLSRVPVRVKWRGFVLLDDTGAYHPVAV